MATMPGKTSISLSQIQQVWRFYMQSSQSKMLSSFSHARNVDTRKLVSSEARTQTPGRCSMCRAPARRYQLSRSLSVCRGNVRGSQKQDWIYSADFKPDIDLEYLSQNVHTIADGVSRRKGNVDVHEVLVKLQQFQQLQTEVLRLQERIRDFHGNKQNASELEELLEKQQTHLHEAERDFYQLAVALPNNTHPAVPQAEDAEPQLIEEVNEKRSYDFPMKGHVVLGENLDIIRLKNLGHITGHRSYFLKGAGALLEDALVRFTLDRLVKRHGFTVLRVPDIVKPVVFEGCGMRTKGLHTQVYRLSPAHHESDMCLAGTAEVGIAGYFMNKTLSVDDLPMRVAAMSRCFRAETAHSAEARGLYRVHQFTKVEMFCVAANETGEESEQLFHELVAIQRGIFKDMGLHFQILDMPAHDLGAPAYRKYDMEAWMPHRTSYGEISSTSNCTDFQSRRLNIKYKTSQGSDTTYAHTLNGTACAVPRMIIAILENFQQRDGSICVPDPLQPYMNGLKEITKPASGFLHFTRL